MLQSTGAMQYAKAEPLRNAALTATACLTPILVGAMIAILPAGTVGRLFAGLFGVLFALIAVSWPDTTKTNFRWLTAGACISFCLMFLWPKYAYIPLDVLPTKNPQRMFYLAFLAYFVFSISTSHELRRLFVARLKSAPGLMALVLLLFVWRVASAAAAKDPLASSYAALVEAFEFLTPFLLVIAIFRDKRDLDRLVVTLLATSLLICVLALIEGIVRKNLFEPLIVIDRSRLDFFQEALAAKVRDGQYRVKATFHHPLLLAEYLVCMLPLLFYRFGRARRLEKALIFVLLATIPFLFYQAQSRSAIVVGLLATLAYAGVHVLRTLSRKRLDMQTVLCVLAVPVMMALAALTYSYVVELAIGRSQAEQTSTIARLTMLTQGIPLVLDRAVLGHGVGNGALALGYIGETGRITLDNYYLLLTLDSGVPALLLLLAIIGWAATAGLRAMYWKDAGQAYLCVALSVSALSFAAVKAILATEHNFPLFFMMLAALVVLRSPAVQAPEAGGSANKLRVRGDK